MKKRKVGRPRKHANPFDEVIKKHFSQNHKKEKQVSLSSSMMSSSVTTIKANKAETSSSGQYKIKPKLKAEVKVSLVYTKYVKDRTIFVKIILISS